LPVTIPKTVGQIPLYYDHANTGRPPKPYDFPTDAEVVDKINLNLGNTSNYLDVTPYPLYPFGYGLSYTTFEYGPVKLSNSHLSAGGTLTIRAPITNTGKRTADEVAQLYIRSTGGGVVHPVRELKGFQRIHLEPGETKDAQFSLSADSLVYHNAQGDPMPPSGKIEVYVGGSSLAPQVGTFTAGD
jgi:beta-glucosidase